MTAAPELPALIWHWGGRETHRSQVDEIDCPHPSCEWSAASRDPGALLAAYKRHCEEEHLK